MLLKFLRRKSDMSFWEDLKTACQDVADAADENKSLLYMISGIVLGTAACVVAVVESKEAYELLDEKHAREADEDISKPMQIATDIVEVAPNYILPVILLTAAAVLEVKSYKVNMQVITTLGTALTIAERKNREYDIYKKKVRETIGKNKEEKIAHEVTKEQIRQDPPSQSFMQYDESDGKMRMRNMDTGSYFRSTPEEIRRAEKIILHRCYVQEFTKLSELLYEADIKDNSTAADIMGWPMGSFPEITFEPVLLDDGVTTITGVRFFRDEDEAIGYIKQNNY